MYLSWHEQQRQSSRKSKMNQTTERKKKKNKQNEKSHQVLTQNTKCELPLELHLRDFILFLVSIQSTMSPSNRIERETRNDNERPYAFVDYFFFVPCATH